jgi:hypothetical protein
MPAFRSVVSVLSREPRETLLYTLKAGPTITGEPAPPHTQVDPTDVYALTDEDAYLEAGGDEKPAIVAAGLLVLQEGRRAPVWRAVPED